MHFVAWTGLCMTLTGVIVACEKRRMEKELEQREMLARPVSREELLEDSQTNMLIPPMGFVQLDPFLRELQAAILAADAARVTSLLAGAGARHPDTMKLDRGLTPLLLAAYMHVRDEEHDRRLRDIMHVLLRRGAHITQREELSGATVLHLLASQPYNCSVVHRIRFLLKVLDEYRNCPARVGITLPGLQFDTVLNDAPAAGGGLDTTGIAVHLLGMRCYQGMLPEDLAPHGYRRNMLKQCRRMLPKGLQDAGNEAACAELN